MIRGVLRSLFVVAVISGTALAEDAPVQVVDKSPPAEAKPMPTAKQKKQHKPTKAKPKHKARKHKKPHRKSKP